VLSESWKKSTRSGPNGQCVEARQAFTGDVEIRNSNDLSQGVMSFTPDEWAAFIEGAKDNEFDLA
jgi:hypothetical protein